MKTAIAVLTGEPLPRAPAVLMTPERLSVLQTSRLSATRLLMAKAIRERWVIERLEWKIDERARGTALYRIHTGRTSGSMPLDFITHSFEPRMEGRMGRIIGQAWDMMAALVEGPVSAEDVRITGEEIHKLYAGRATPGTLIWCRSNRSARVFNHTVDALDAQMLSAYMMRVFSIDLVEHLARCRSPKAAKLYPRIQSFLGVGNGSALGLNLYVNNHPKLIDAWLSAREQAIVAAKRLPLRARDPLLARLVALIGRAETYRREDRMEYERFTASRVIAADLAKVKAAAQVLHDTGLVDGVRPALPLMALADALEDDVNPEAHETLLGLYTELVPELCDWLAENLGVDEDYATEPDMSIGRLRELLHAEYAWAFRMELDSCASNRFVWYKSATAEEPRRGPRAEAGDVFNLGLDLPRLVRALDLEIATRPATQSVARLLLECPALRLITARVQTLSGLQYHSPHMNMMGEELIPCDVTRLINIGIHGLDKTRDYMQRALRGVIYQGAPTVDEIARGADPDWFWPSEPVL